MLVSDVADSCAGGVAGAADGPADGAKVEVEAAAGWAGVKVALAGLRFWPGNAAGFEEAVGPAGVKGALAGLRFWPGNVMGVGAALGWARNKPGNPPGNAVGVEAPVDGATEDGPCRVDVV